MSHFLLSSFSKRCDRFCTATIIIIIQISNRLCSHRCVRKFQRRKACMGVVAFKRLKRKVSLSQLSILLNGVNKMVSHCTLQRKIDFHAIVYATKTPDSRCVFYWNGANVNRLKPGENTQFSIVECIKSVTHTEKEEKN